MNRIEQNVIGSLFICGDDFAISRAADKLTVEMFETDIAGRIFLEYQKAYDNHEVIDTEIIRQRLLDAGFTEIFIQTEMTAAADSVVSSANILGYIDALQKRYRARRLYKAINSFKVTASGVDDQIGALQTELENIAVNKEISAKSLPEIVEQYKGEYFREKPPRITIGFPKLDEIIGGFENGDLIIIAARPGVGKSAFVTQFVAALGKKGKKIGFYNLEMTSKQMYERFIVNESGLSLSLLRNAEMVTVGQMEKFKAANETLSKQTRIRIIDEGIKTVKEIRAESRHMNYDLIVIDYLQLLTPENTYRGNRQAEVGEISRGLKSLAKELNIPIIALSQLNRASEGRENKEPSMAELREAGNLEQDASVIILLWNIDEDRQKKGCKVDKNRQGKLGKVILEFDGDRMQFKETSETTEQAKPKKKNPFKNEEPKDEYMDVDLNDTPFI